MKIIHSKTGIVLGKNIKEARTFWPRLTGFMFKKNTLPYDGIFFPDCKTVHNSFVRFSLDVVFIGKDDVIVKIIRDFRPWKFSGIYLNALHALELAAGSLPTAVSEGDKLLIES